MRVTVKYMAQIKQTAGVPQEDVQLSAPCAPLELVQRLAEHHGDGLRRLLLSDDGGLQPTILMFVNDAQVNADSERMLQDGDEVTFLSPIAGG